jgi:hypothetical protein
VLGLQGSYIISTKNITDMAKKPPISPQKIQLKNVKKRVKILKKPPSRLVSV